TVPLLAATIGLLAGCGSLSKSGESASSDPAAIGPTADDVNQTGASDAQAQAHAHYGAAVVHDLKGEEDLALQEYAQAAKQDPGNEWLVLEVTRRLLQGKQPEQALELLQQAVAQPNAGGAVYARLGLVYSQMGKQAESVQASRIAIKKSPRALAGYQHLFVALVQNKQNDEALKVLNDAAKQTQVAPEFLAGLSELYISYAVQVPSNRTNATLKALAALDRAAKSEPLTPTVQLKIADGYSMLKESQKAAQIYLELLKTLPDVPVVREHVHAKLADIYLRASDSVRAMEQLQALAKEDPSNPQVHYYMGSIAQDQKKPAEAIDHFTKTVLLSPNFEPAYYDLASAQLSADKPGDALATLNKARARFSSSFVLELLTALVFSQQKSYQQAIQYYTAAEVVARATDPKRLTHIFYLQVGAAYERTGNYAQAEKQFLKALELSPDFPEALNYLGYMWAERGENLEKARAMLEKAVKAEPKNAAYLDSLGWALFKLNQPAQALEHILKSVALLEEPDATVYDHLGDIYHALGQADKAREAWTKSLAVESNEQVKAKLDAPK
ncbi:MAG TPA: tetratricopeptide repeat protein, partial [Clostridia bacterium]|nr:tetratricopeptide repeat protein [Clostridia bacterium]